MMLGTIRFDLNNLPGAAESFRRAIKLDPSEINKWQRSRSCARRSPGLFCEWLFPPRPRPMLQPVVDSGPDSESSWLLSRVYLQQGDKPRALAALKSGRLVPCRQSARA